ncbi:hypothetical protein SSBR45G_36130 [Bradyrhizobium sp. SSBR45G]|nr:hypothetical protein SSBR45G_36130 [Bradyrhizobium sp. SSBR45G]GLH87468.1 hypothetical protein SSBR45R_49280 [Bradyrhizobium sp. SSBR45R]
MKLIFLHGAPAVGKLTTAKALLQRVDGRLHDNHAAIDVARTVFEFGAPGFWELVYDVRCATFEAAARHGVPLVVTTCCYAEPHDRPKYQGFEQIMQRCGGELLPVFLHCSIDDALQRVGNADRVARRKMTSPDTLRRELGIYQFTPVRSDCLTIDTSELTAEAAADRFAIHYGLTPRADGA